MLYSKMLYSQTLYRKTLYRKRLYNGVPPEEKGNLNFMLREKARHGNVPESAISETKSL